MCYLIWGHRTIIIKHHILKHHIPELPSDGRSRDQEAGAWGITAHLG